MTGNCFTQNEVSVAPVLSFGGNVMANMNSGSVDKLSSRGACEFIAKFDDVDDPSSPTSPSAGDFFCVPFDEKSCHGHALNASLDNDPDRTLPLRKRLSPQTSRGATLFVGLAVLSTLVVCVFPTLYVIHREQKRLP